MVIPFYILHQDGGDEARDGGFVRKEAGHAGAAFDLVVEGQRPGAPLLESEIQLRSEARHLTRGHLHAAELSMMVVTWRVETPWRYISAMATLRARSVRDPFSKRREVGAAIGQMAGLLVVRTFTEEMLRGPASGSALPAVQSHE
jgi:hypothetical protein